MNDLIQVCDAVNGSLHDGVVAYIEDWLTCRCTRRLTSVAGAPSAGRG
jgi:hypothetical protein